MGYSIDPISANCYEGTTCLINKFDIRNEEQLANLEATITHAKTTLLESQPAKLPLDFTYYKAIHRFLFEDLYDWAGQLRTIDISKKGTAFCPADQLEPLCNACFDRLAKINYFKGLPRSQFIEKMLASAELIKASQFWGAFFFAYDHSFFGVWPYFFL